MVSSRRLFILAAALACGEPSEPEPIRGTPDIRILEGADVTDTIDAIQSQPLVVQIFGEDGRAARRAVVRFTSTNGSGYQLRAEVSATAHDDRAIQQRYARRLDAWRTISDDWIQRAETLALFLDTFTNNSSLALAIELVESGKVLLLAADAEAGNWLSWKDVKWERQDVNTDDLLARTVVYKVGHHASHNATLVETFEKMGHPDLVALIPVHKKDPNITKKNGWKMPARNLFRKLIEKTDHRVLQMDGVNPPSCDPKKNPAKAARKKLGITPKVTDMSIGIDIEG